MANKTYKMTVSLSDGSTVDAGTFVAPQGPQGVKGDKGAKGDTGAQGPQGLKGDKGDTGAQGPQGIQGPQGPEGPAGPAGTIGDWVSISESNFTAEANSVYLIKVDGYSGDTAILATRAARTTKVSFFDVGTDSVTITHYMIGSNGKFSRIRVAKITSGKVTVTELTPSSVKDIYYIKLK